MTMSSSPNLPSSRLLRLPVQKQCIELLVAVHELRCVPLDAGISIAPEPAPVEVDDCISILDVASPVERVTAP